MKQNNSREMGRLGKSEREAIGMEDEEEKSNNSR